ncbi:transposase [Candidatus Nitrosocosmicus agrestis]|uniref:transposase n=1 Tax=Candidatus Nitrosocosmicus agrestis TaxID=2563600 RepID=UPI00122E39A5|nr:transposase [Candidatus Nitrosocosmicus sp. SS]KAA2279536.1 hypothetical protein F1Z66_13165 [Candidatus Nitrosocosmicus sp. SS]KAF0868181.1 hypothetical protein E5N71_11595 [Candidatus Nitrosocosmicus sp. SS]
MRRYSWTSTTFSKVFKAQKIKGMQNVFGVYDHTNNQKWTHGYKQSKTGKHFLVFIKRIEQKYNNSIKQIFSVLDNVSIHKSNKVKQNLASFIQGYVWHFFKRDLLNII